MGGAATKLWAASSLTDEQLARYQDLTFFTKKEILHVHARFKELSAEEVQQNYNARLGKEKIMNLTELKVNPFSDRICEVFSSSGDGNISFEDFLDMMSVFSDGAPKAVKVDYAFRIYDFDGDGVISHADMKQVIDRLTGDNKLSDDEMQQLIDNITLEVDLDNDGGLSLAEFQHVMSKSPDFASSFRIRL